MEPSHIDLAAGILLAAGFWRGWRKGLLRAILGPACLLIFSVIGVIHFDLTRNIVTSVLLALLGAAALSLLVRLLLIIGRARIPKEERDFVFIGSRMLGSIISTFWIAALLGAVLVLWAVVPLKKGTAGDIQKNILKSRSCFLANKFLVYPYPPVRNVLFTFQALLSPSHLQQLSAHPEFEAFLAHPKVQNTLRDPDILLYITRKDYKKLLAEPKVWDIIRDDKLMACLTRVSRKIYEEKSRKQKKAARK